MMSLKIVYKPDTQHSDATQTCVYLLCHATWGCVMSCHFADSINVFCRNFAATSGPNHIEKTTFSHFVGMRTFCQLYLP